MSTTTNEMLEVSVSQRKVRQATREELAAAHRQELERLRQPEGIPRTENATTSKQTHSATPWRTVTAATRFEITDAEEFPVLRINGGMIPVRRDAEFIELAVNNHEALVAALETFIGIYPANTRRHPDVALAIAKAEAALARVRKV